MKAISYTQYGSPDVLQFKEVEKPVPRDDEVLIRVHATTVNRTDCAIIRAKPFFMRIMTGLFTPKKHIPGTEFAGEVEAVGKSVTSLTVGEHVFGFDALGAGSHAQYLTIQEDNVVRMPDNISYEQAAASSEGAHYAYSCINKVHLKKGQYVLVNGATGAIGSAAVQLLHYFGVYVTAVCGTKHIELIKSLGANKVIDYTQEDFTQDDGKYHFIFDAVGKSSFFQCKHLLHPGGTYLSSDLGSMAQNMFLPLLTPMIQPMIGYKKTGAPPFPADIRKSLLFIKDLIEQDKFTAVIDRKFPLEYIVEAYTYVEKEQKIGNVVIMVDHHDT